MPPVDVERVINAGVKAALAECEQRYGYVGAENPESVFLEVEVNMPVLVRQVLRHSLVAMMNADPLASLAEWKARLADG